MKFSSEEERLQHPIVGLIPYPVWHRYFDKDPRILSKILPLMHTQTEELIPYLTANYNGIMVELTAIKPDSRYSFRQEMLWLALAFGHPDINDALLIQIADLMSLQKETLTDVVIIFGRLSLLESIYLDCSQVLISTNYRGFSHAAANGHLMIMKRLITSIPDDKLERMLMASGYESFTQAATYGHLIIVKYLLNLSQDKIQDMIERDIYFDAARATARHGHLEVLTYLIDLAASKTTQEHIAMYAFFSADLTCKKYLVNRFPDKVQAMISAGNYKVVMNAAHFNRIDILAYLLTIDPIGPLPQLADGFRYAADRWSVSVIDYLLNIPFICNHTNRLTQRLPLNRPLFLEFIDRRLSALHHLYDQLGQESFYERFDDKQADETVLLCCILENLICRDDPVVFNDVQFLLRIPAVQALIADDDLILALGMARVNVIACIISVPARMNLLECLLSIPEIFESRMMSLAIETLRDKDKISKSKHYEDAKNLAINIFSRRHPSLLFNQRSRRTPQRDVFNNIALSTYIMSFIAPPAFNIKDIVASAPEFR